MIYFLHCPLTGLTKIGSAQDVHKRVRDIQHMSPTPLEVVAVRPGDRRDEHNIHRTFNARRKHGEWFDMRGIEYQTDRDLRHLLGPVLVGPRAEVYRRAYQQEREKKERRRQQTERAVAARTANNVKRQREASIAALHRRVA